jgi:hypothetical protein
VYSGAAHSTFAVAKKESAEPMAMAIEKCTIAHEQLGEPSRGRWVREPWPNETACPTPFAVVMAPNKNLPMTEFDDDYPHCWHREDLTKIGSKCIEMNCDNIDKASQWNSSLHKEQQFMGVWRPYACLYHEFTTEQLQECVTKRKIVRFKKKGASIATFMDQFVQKRLTNVTLYDDSNATDPEARTVVFDTLSLLHKNGPDGSMEEAVMKLPVAPENEEHYFITGFFLSSEREVVRR